MPIPISRDLLPPRVRARVAANARLLARRRPLDREALDRLRAQLRVLHTYHSNAIEGNTLTLRETQLVLEEGVTVGGKSLREHLEAAGNAAGFDWVWARAGSREPLGHVALQELHALVMRGTSEWAGRYRVQNVRITGCSHVPPGPGKIVRMLDGLFADLAGRGDPVLRSAYLHHRLAFIHPFLDGNGRVTRLAANLSLLRDGYPAVVLRAAERGDYAPFAAFVLRGVDEALVHYLAALVPGRELVPLSVLARGTRYSQEYLSLRARQGVLEAAKVDGVWCSSREAVARYVARGLSARRDPPRPRREHGRRGGARAAAEGGPPADGGRTTVRTRR